MADSFNFSFFQIPATGVEEPELEAARTDVATPIRRPLDMKISNFGALEVGNRLSEDYTRTDTGAFKFKGESEDINRLTEDTGIGQNVRLFGVSVNHNPLIWGSTVKYTRDDQFIRMTMDKDSDDASAELPKFDVMDSDVVTAEGIMADANAAIKNWPTEGWRTYGGKYDFLPYDGGLLK